MSKFVLTFFTSILIVLTGFSQQSGSITGKLVDASNGEPLFFANVSLEGTALGSVTNEEGIFEIPSVPSGQYTLVLLYVGYKTIELPVEVNSGETVNIGTHELTIESVMGEEVVVTGQLRGQASAINQQVKSNKIVNVVSAEKIREVPDVNAAESVGRLPGISVQRSAGEGQKIAIRGVDPRFNSITINGQKVSSTSGQDRSVDLSMISSDALAGIEVYKALTPDQDGDAIGGTVNIITKEAEEGFHVRALAQGGYNNIINGIGSYKGTLTLSNRFFNNKFGIIVSGTGHESVRDVDRYGLDYDASQSDSEGNPIIVLNNVRLQDRNETRARYSGTATLDYKLNNGKLVFNYFYAQMNRDVSQREIRYREPVFNVNYDYNSFENNSRMHNPSLIGEFDLGRRLEVSFNANMNFTRNETPLGYGTGFDEAGGFNAEMIPANPTPEDIVNAAKHNLANAYGGGLGFNNDVTTDKNGAGQVDLKWSFNLGSLISGYVKAGGKIRYKERIRDNNTTWHRDFINFQRAYIRDHPEGSFNGTNITIYNYLDRDFDPIELESGFELQHAMDGEIVYNTLMMYMDSSRFWQPNYAGDFLDDYDATERITAGYLMSEINIGKNLMILPGFRVEETYNKYSGLTGFVDNRGGRQVPFTNDTTADKKLVDFLPMIHLRYQFTDFLTMRLAATKTLGRPNFFNLAPFEYIDQSKERTIVRGSTELLNTTSWNYDAQITYFGRFGLLTLGGFYKSLNNIDVDFETKNLEVPFSDPYFGYSIENPINLDYETTVRGFEIDLQSNFRFLPKPFDGIVITANYSRILSETFFPFFKVDYPPPNYTAVVIDTARSGRVPGQAAQTLNVTLGYEKGGFSGRITYAYQGDLLQTVSTNPELDVYQGEYKRWDATLAQKIFTNFTILANLINITDEPDYRYMGIQDNLSLLENYGWQVTLGIRYDF